jgi:hypothetical protein
MGYSNIKENSTVWVISSGRPYLYSEGQYFTWRAGQPLTAEGVYSAAVQTQPARLRLHSAWLATTHLQDQSLQVNLHLEGSSLLQSVRWVSGCVGG